MGLLSRLHLVWTLVRRPVTLGVKAAIFDADGRILLVKHSYTPGWHLPGGGVGRDERLSDAVRREVNEELGLTVQGQLSVFAVYFAPHRGKSDHIALFRVTEYEGDITPNWEIAEAGFFRLHDLPEAITPATARRLAELAGDGPAPERW